MKKVIPIILMISLLAGCSVRFVPDGGTTSIEVDPDEVEFGDVVTDAYEEIQIPDDSREDVQVSPADSLSAAGKVFRELYTTDSSLDAVKESSDFYLDSTTVNTCVDKGLFTESQVEEVANYYLAQDFGTYWLYFPTDSSLVWKVSPEGVFYVAHIIAEPDAPTYFIAGDLAKTIVLELVFNNTDLFAEWSTINGVLNWYNWLYEDGTLKFQNHNGDEVDTIGLSIE